MAEPDWLTGGQKITALTKLLGIIRECQKQDDHRAACYISNCKDILKHLETLLKTDLISCDLFSEDIDELLDNFDEAIDKITGFIELVEDGID